MTQFDLNKLIEKLAQLRQQEHRRRNIAVNLDLDEGLPEPSVDGPQIERVILALLARARNAIGQAKRPHGTIAIRTALKGQQIQFSITDNGIADPSRDIDGTFFTRPLQEDISLTMCAEIVQDQGGELYAWQPIDLAVTTLIMDLPAGR